MDISIIKIWKCYRYDCLCIFHFRLEVHFSHQIIFFKGRCEIPFFSFSEISQAVTGKRLGFHKPIMP